MIRVKIWLDLAPLTCWVFGVMLFLCMCPIRAVMVAMHSCWFSSSISRSTIASWEGLIFSTSYNQDTNINNRTVIQNNPGWAQLSFTERNSDRNRTNSFGRGASLSFWVLGAKGEALDSSGEVKLAHFFAQAAVDHVGLGGQVNWCFYK